MSSVCDVTAEIQIAVLSLIVEDRDCLLATQTTLGVTNPLLVTRRLLNYLIEEPTP